jgi:integrase
MLIVAALDTGMRRGELLKLRFGDIDVESGFIRVRPENAKSGKSRMVPIATTRFRTLLEWLRIGPKGEVKPDDVAVFSRGDDEALKSFRTAWELTRRRAKLQTVRFHDFRSEYASRLVERNVPLSQVRDLLGHSTITTTERYDRQTAASLKQSAEKLDTGEPFKNLSISAKFAAPVESVSSSH